jgi:uncharacterized membrane protein
MLFGKELTAVVTVRGTFIPRGLHPRCPTAPQRRYPARMAVDVRTEVVIARPVEAVAPYAAHPDNAPDWYVNIKSIEWVTPPPLQIGSRMAFVADFLGRRLAYTYEVVEWEPGRRLVMRTADGPFPMETTYEWFPVGDGQTRMTLRNRGVPSGFSSLVAPFMAMAMRRANRKDLARLKERVEHSHIR